MTSQVEICNIALSNIRAKSINNINEASVNAQYCKLKYDLVLDFMLRSSPWNFAKKQTALALLESELFGWIYAYQYPTDCLRINRLMSAVDQLALSDDGYAFRPDYYSHDPLLDHANHRVAVKYEVLTFSNNKVIGVNQPEVWVDYQFSVTDPNEYDSSFIMAFAWYLAAEIAVPVIGGDNGRAERGAALQMYKATLAEAMAMDSNEQNNGPPRESEFILTRS